MINQYEFLGIVIGDGCLLYYPKHHIYGLEITGNPYEEQDYYQEIKKFIENKFDLKVRVYTRKLKKGNGLKLVCYGKRLADWLKVHGIKRKKTYFTSIPSHLLDWKFSKFIIKGIFETDGSIYFSKSKKHPYPTYPRLEICTASLKLAGQIVSILNDNGFKAKSYIKHNTITIYMSGENMINKWKKEIGFAGLKNHTKYDLWKKFGFYIPRISLQERLALLSVCGQAAKICSEESG